MSKRATTNRDGILYDVAEKNLPLTQVELATVLQVSKGTIQNYTRQGMPVIYLGAVKGGRGSNPRYRFKDCEKWINERYSSI